MADFAPIVGALYDVFAPLVGPLVRGALRAIARSVAAMVVLVALVAAGAYMLGARHGSPFRGVVALLVAGGLVAACTPLVALQRAVGRAAGEVLSSKVAPKLVSLVFDGLLGVADEGEAGARGSSMQQRIEKLPLADLERRGRALVARLGNQGGFLLSYLRRRLVSEIEGLTLESLRAESGGIDLADARLYLEAKVTSGLGARVQRAFTRKAMLLVGLATFVGLVVAYLLGR